jgi:gamma-glutamyltranspeptidase/glutathione hydrolase
VEAPVDAVLSDGHADLVAARIRGGEHLHVPRLNEMDESRNTTHACVMDHEGSCVSLTHSLGFPSGVITDGLGFMYNGGMASFDPRPGRTHSIEPGKARFSSIMPTVLFEGAETRLVVGGVGATQIAMGVVQVILNVVDFDRSMTEAVVEPRFCATSDVLEVVNRIPRSITGRLEDLGYEVRRFPMSFGVAWVYGIRVVPDGSLDGAADPASDGVALAVEP